MEFDSIPFDEMSPDTSSWQKGLGLVKNMACGDAGVHREIRTLVTEATTTLAGGTFPSLCGRYSDPDGRIYAAVRDSFTSNSLIYECPASPAAWANVSKGAIYNGAPLWWDFTKFGPTVIAAPWNNGIGVAQVLQKRTGSTGLFSDLVTSADRPAPKYVTACHTHVIGANLLGLGGAGVFAAADPYSFAWCSRNNAAIWTPTVNAAGFQPVNDQAGEITAVAGFKEYFLLWQQDGISRCTWIGGDAVWQTDEISTRQFGTGDLAMAQLSVVRVNRDAYFLSSRGLAVVSNGESVALIGDGKVRRFLMDPLGSVTNNFAFLTNAVVIGDYSPTDDTIIWVGTNNVGSKFAVTYHLPSDRFTVWDDIPTIGEFVACFRRRTPGIPLAAFVLIQRASDQLKAVTRSGNSTATGYFQTSHWRPKTGLKANLKMLRLLLLTDPRGLTPAPYPAINITVEASFDPLFLPASTTSSTITITSATDRDPQGWFTSYPLPLEGTEFRFTITIGDLGNQMVIDECPALELGFDTTSLY